MKVRAAVSGITERIARRPAWPEGVNEPGRPVILLYHSISDDRPDPFGIRVSPRHFEQHMAAVAAYCTPIRLANIDDASGASLRPRSVIVTFDDGFADNLLHAKPILERYRIPATVFAATALLDTPREYWWDELDRILLGRHPLPRELKVRIGSTTYERDLHGAERMWWWRTHRTRNWKHWQTDFPTPRQQAYHELWNLMHAATSAVRDQALDDLRRWAGLSEPGRPSRLACTSAQLRELAAGDLIEIGGHTVTHPSLAALFVEQQRAEIVGCKARLQDILQKPVASFSYPYGTKTDYDINTVNLVKSSGFELACSNFPAPIASDTDRYQLPRRIVPDWNAKEFIKRLAGWFAE